MSCKPTYKGIRYNSLEELYRANGFRTLFGKMKMKEIAIKYGISVNTIELIKMNKLWVA